MDSEQVAPETLGTLDERTNPDQVDTSQRRRGDTGRGAAQGSIKLGVHPKTIQVRLGHSSIKTTMDLYGHLVNANLWQAAQLVEGIIGASEPVFGRRATIRNPGESATASAG